METKPNVVGWFELPVLDMDRPVEFYQTVFGFELSRGRFGPMDMAMFPAVDKGMGAAGALARPPAAYRPSPDGIVIYFTAFSGDVAIELSRVQAAGGQGSPAEKAHLRGHRLYRPLPRHGGEPRRRPFAVVNWDLNKYYINDSISFRF